MEVLSPDDRFSQILEKCKNYARIGISRIFVIDPETRLGYVWSIEEAQLQTTEEMALPNGASIRLPELWERLAAELG